MRAIHVCASCTTTRRKSRAIQFAPFKAVNRATLAWRQHSDALTAISTRTDCIMQITYAAREPFPNGRIRRVCTHPKNWMNIDQLYKVLGTIMETRISKQIFIITTIYWNNVHTFEHLIGSCRIILKYFKQINFRALVTFRLLNPVWPWPRTTSSLFPFTANYSKQNRLWVVQRLTSDE